MGEKKVKKELQPKRQRPFSTKSLENLKKGPETAGRKRFYTENKTNHSVKVTATGWSSSMVLAKGMGMSVSEMLEQIGRGQLLVVPAQEKELEEQR